MKIIALLFYVVSFSVSGEIASMNHLAEESGEWLTAASPAFAMSTHKQGPGLTMGAWTPLDFSIYAGLESGAFFLDRHHRRARYQVIPVHFSLVLRESPQKHTFGVVFGVSIGCDFTIGQFLHRGRTQEKIRTNFSVLGRLGAEYWITAKTALGVEARGGHLAAEWFFLPGLSLSATL